MITTNILATLSFILITNWTGVVVDGRELGYVATNHVSKIDWQGKSYEFILKTVPSEIARWKPTVSTNWVMYMTNIGITNDFHLFRAVPHPNTWR